QTSSKPAMVRSHSAPSTMRVSSRRAAMPVARSAVWPASDASRSAIRDIVVTSRSYDLSGKLVLAGEQIPIAARQMPQNSPRGYQRLMGGRGCGTHRMRRIDEGDFRDGDESAKPFDRHAQGHEQDDQQADPGDPAMLVQQARDKGGGN